MGGDKGGGGEGEEREGDMYRERRKEGVWAGEGQGREGPQGQEVLLFLFSFEPTKYCHKHVFGERRVEAIGGKYYIYTQLYICST